jgi:pre-rRNA-processing protein IPI3
LNTFEFPQPISCIVLDLAERFFFAASGDGSIHQMDIFRHYEDTIGMQAAHGSGVGDSIPTRKRLISLRYHLLFLTIAY